MKRSAADWVRFFLPVPGFMVELVLLLVRTARKIPRVPSAFAETAKKHPFAVAFLGLTAMAGVFLMGWGALHLTYEAHPQKEISAYNEAVRGIYIRPAPNDPTYYCYGYGEFQDPGEMYGGVQCPGKADVEILRNQRRAGNLAQKELLEAVSGGFSDPSISSRALYNIGTIDLRDAVDFQDIQSLKAAILALQNSLRDDPAYEDRFHEGSVEFVRDRRINLEIALLIQEAVKSGKMQGWGNDGQEGEGKDGDGSKIGPGAGKSNPGRSP